MLYDEEEYVRTSDLDIEILLAELPFNLTRENIIEQINDPLSIQVNYITTLMDKCEIVKKEFVDNSEVIKEINTNLRSIFELILREMNDKFNLGMSINESDDDIVKIGESLYNYLILRYRKNISRFIYRFILKNKKDFIERFDVNKKKDITSLALKKQFKNKDEVILITSLPKIIKYIMSLEIEPIDFLDTISKGEHYEATIIKDAILSGQIIGNFIPKYFYLMIDEYEHVMDQIQTDIRLKLINKIKNNEGKRMKNE